MPGFHDRYALPYEFRITLPRPDRDLVKDRKSEMKKIMMMWVLLAAPVGTVADDWKIESSEFVFDRLPHESCHASTLVETKNGLAAAWFGGTREGHPSVGIWFSKKGDKGWSRPLEIANGNQKDGTRFPSWNPVLFQMPRGDLFLFYKVGPNPREWWGEMKKSADGGLTWSAAKRLKEGVIGPVKNKPVLLKDGRLLCGSSTEHDGWRVHMEWSKDPWDVSSWHRSPALDNGSAEGAIQPTILKTGGGYRILCRNRKKDRILTGVSPDGTGNWSKLSVIDLPNPNSGIDAVTLQEGTHLLVYNHTPGGRSPINVAVSEKGNHWKQVLVLDNEARQEFSYPAVIEAADGKVHISYTWKRKKIKHFVLSRKP